jgi:hypothetical protein
VKKSNRTIILAVTFLVGLALSLEAAQKTNPRFGKWKLKSDAPPPALNIMTYEPHGDGGMKITVEATNAKGEKRMWTYVTMFDGKYRPVEGDTNTEESAVEVVDAHTNKIMNKTGDRVNVIINVLSEDGNTINNEYRNVGEDGKVSVSHAVYERIQ